RRGGQGGHGQGASEEHQGPGRLLERRHRLPEQEEPDWRLGTVRQGREVEAGGSRRLLLPGARRAATEEEGRGKSRPREVPAARPDRIPGRRRERPPQVDQVTGRALRATPGHPERSEGSRGRKAPVSAVLFRVPSSFVLQRSFVAALLRITGWVTIVLVAPA